MKTELSQKPVYKNGVYFFSCGGKSKNPALISECPAPLKSYLTAYLDAVASDSEKSRKIPADAIFSLFHPEMGRVVLASWDDTETGGGTAKIGGRVAKTLLKQKVSDANVIFPADKKYKPNDKSVFEFWTGFAKANYQLNKFTAHKGGGLVEKLNLYGAESSALKHIKAGEIIADAVHFARNTENTPGNLFRPSDFKKKQRGSPKNTALEKMGMGCFHAVAKGSSEKAYLNILKHSAKGASGTVMLVGKGLTFDSGGYSLKPAGSMEDMKFDKCGGAAVLAVMEAVARLKLKLNVIGLIPSSENLINGQAMKPGDIYTACNGKTVEVLNTDAEGRLILCDSIAYGIKKYKPDAVIDIATLTGACMVALGGYNAGLFSNDDKLADALFKSGENSGDRVWRLPMNAEYRKDIESTYADIKNVGGRGAGAITAAWFLREFVGDTPWAHIDIAGVDSDIKHVDYYPDKGATGFGLMSENAKLILQGKEYSLPVNIGTEQEVCVDISQLRNQSGAITMDNGFANTGSCFSSITYLDGEQGILRYRGYDVNELCEKSRFLEVCYLLLYGELPSQKDMDDFESNIKRHTMINEDYKRYFDVWPHSAHPMALLGSSIAGCLLFIRIH
ncbi:hypothetical protein CHS0354_018352 [Potamilus streckersoni]|uniref:Cytosol aminopeptidase domain-containing protein n=1 Tax=Potamilus streckersoni TaxID=2493646 RepID=A0AAE0TBL1_9BIVA|nr:hypothetical protein CHS0354_018352 [Potamilus streckersoni]